MIGCGFEVLNF